MKLVTLILLCALFSSCASATRRKFFSAAAKGWTQGYNSGYNAVAATRTDLPPARNANTVMCQGQINPVTHEVYTICN